MRLLLSGVLLLSVIVGPAVGCYEDTISGPHNTQGATRVFLKGMPYWDTRVAEIELYVVDISASAQRDSTGEQQVWTVLAMPYRRIPLLSTLREDLALVAEAELPHDLYYAVRLSIDTDSSVVTFHDGTEANVDWPVSGIHKSYAFVEMPISVPDGGTSIVLDFDLEESLVGGLGDPLHDFHFSPVFWAVDAAVTGGIHGTILGDTDAEGTALPVADARVSVFRGSYLSSSEPGLRRALGRTDSTGYYCIDFLNPGPHTLRIEPTVHGTFSPVSAHELEVTSADYFVFSVTLPRKSATGGMYWR